jgi:hypothetical protein
MPFPAFDHLPENLSDKPFEVIGVELQASEQRTYELSRCDVEVVG